MAMTINTNIVSINAQRNLSLSGNSLSTTMQRLSSGLRVNSAKDDAAGLAIAERMNAQARGLAVAARNANDGISLAQTAEGALGKMGDMLQRMRELAVQSSNATNSAADREALQSEVSQLRAEIDRVAKTTTFNGQKILDGSFSGGVFQVGAGAGDNITVGNITNAKADSLGYVEYAAKTLNASADEEAFSDLSAIKAGDTNELKIKVGENEYALGTIAKANSSQERLGQLVAAINAKTADTGVTAFLQKDEAGAMSIQLLSKNVEDVTANGVTSRQAVAVTLEGFTLQNSGLEPSAEFTYAAPQNGVEGYKAQLQKIVDDYGLTMGGTEIDDIANVNTAADAKSAVDQAWAERYEETADDEFVADLTFTRTSNVIEVDDRALSTDAPSTALLDFAAEFGVTLDDSEDWGNADNPPDIDTAIASIVSAAQLMDADDIADLGNEAKAFAIWARMGAASPAPAAPTEIPPAFDADTYTVEDMLAAVGNALGMDQAPSAEDVFGTDATTWVDNGTWAAGTDDGFTAALAAYEAAQAYVEAQAGAGALGIVAADVKKDDGMTTLSISTQADAWKALQTVDNAINQVNAARAELGALQTRFEKSIENIDIQSENINAARGRIVDADFASETANLSRSQILQQAGTAMVAQANQLPQNVLSLLR